MSDSQYVPFTRGHPKYNITLRTLDNAVNQSRKRLHAALSSGDTATYEQAFQQYDTTVAEVDRLYQLFNGVIEEGQVIIDGIRRMVTNYLGKALNGMDQDLAHVTTKVGALEPVLAQLIMNGRPPPNARVEELYRQLAATLIDLDTVLQSRSTAIAEMITGCRHRLAPAWCTHGFGCQFKLAAHDAFAVPISMYEYLTEAIGGPGIDRGSGLFTAAWQELNAMPIGTRLGALCRYAFGPATGNLLLLEQLLLEPCRSLLSEEVHHRLVTALDTKPNASRPTGGYVPLLAILYAHALHRPADVADIAGAVGAFDQSGLYDAMKTRMTHFGATGLCVGPPNKHLDALADFFNLASVFQYMAGIVEPASVPRAPAVLALSEDTHALCASFAALVSMRKHAANCALASRVLLWILYASQGDVNERRYSEWTLLAADLMKAAHCFKVKTSFLSNSSWEFKL